MHVICCVEGSRWGGQCWLWNGLIPICAMHCGFTGAEQSLRFWHCLARRGRREEDDFSDREERTHFKLFHFSNHGYTAKYVYIDQIAQSSIAQLAALPRNEFIPLTFSIISRAFKYLEHVQACGHRHAVLVSGIRIQSEVSYWWSSKMISFNGRSCWPSWYVHLDLVDYAPNIGILWDFLRKFSKQAEKKSSTRRIRMVLNFSMNASAASWLQMQKQILLTLCLQ